MKTLLTRRLENVSVFLAMMVISIAMINFLLSHQLTDHHETRFLFSGAILAIIALFLRFAISIVQPLHRATYRVSLVMFFWSIGIYLFPYPHYLLYLISLPTLFFIYRLEVKQELAPQEDRIALGILLTLTTFLYLQQQPLQAILFPDLPFHWDSYFRNAPVILLTGLALLRLQKWVRWPSLLVIGATLTIVGLSLSLGMLGKQAAIEQQAIIYAVVFSYVLLLLSQIKNPALKLLISFTGLQAAHQKLSAIQLYYLGVFILQFAMALLLYFYPASYWSLPLIVAASGGLLFRYQRSTSSIVLLQLSLLLIYMSWVVFPYLYPWFISAFALLLLSAALLKRSPRYTTYLNSKVISLCCIIFYVTLAEYPVLTPLGLAWIATPFICWLLMPDRPLSLPPRVQIGLIPLIIAIVLLCLHGKVDSTLMVWWAQITIIAPLLIFALFQSAWFRTLSEKRAWHAIERWREDATDSLSLLAGYAVIISIASLYLNLSWYSSDWSPVIQSSITLAIAAALMIYFGLTERRVGYFITAELLLWAILGLIRWKLEIAETLQLGSEIDGYIVMAVGALVAGFREISRRSSAIFETHFHRMTLIYSLLGWAYLLYLGLNNSQSFSAELSSIYLAALTYWLSRTQNRNNLIFTFIFSNIAMTLFFWQQGMNNLMLYLVPALASILVLTHLFKDQLSEHQAKQLRLYCSLALLSLSALYNIGDFNGSIWYPVTAAAISLLGVIVGISLQIRIYLYLGVTFFFINAVGAIGNVIVTQPTEQIKLIVGILFLLTGLLFISSYLLFQMKREQILAKYHTLRGEVDKWD